MFNAEEALLGEKKEDSRETERWRRQRRAQFGRTARRGDGSQISPQEMEREVRFVEGK